MLTAAVSQPGGSPWSQWGGPHRNFTTESSGIKSNWPASGPKVVWKRALGEGYSAPSVDGGTAYTMYGRPNEEVVIALDANTGKTIWEHATPIDFRSDAAGEMGNGPYAAPLVTANRVFTTGVAGRFQALDRKTGKLLWTQGLWGSHGGTRTMYGYASSPLAYRDMIILPVGAKGKATMAFKQSDGSVAWAKGNVPNAYVSPLIINLDGLDQYVAVMDGAVFGLNPLSGDLQWQVPWKAGYGISCSMPVWCPGNLLFVSAEYGAGTKMIRLEKKGLQTNATEAWFSNRLRLHHGNAMWINGSLYFTSGGKGSQAILTGVDAATGNIHWQERSISKATFVWADGKLITLDQDGNLMLADPSPKGFKVIARAELLTSLSWTPPVLVGTRLYLRDRRSMMAVDLG